MPLTRARVEKRMLKRLARYMGAAQMSHVDTGENPDLIDPIATALSEMGTPAVDDLAVTDADMAPILATREIEFLSRVELRLLRNILGNLPDTDTSTMGSSESRNQLPERVRQMVLDLERTIGNTYGEPVTDAPAAGSSSLTGGVARVVFQDNFEDLE